MSSSSDKRPRLRDIVRGNAADFQRAWDETEPSAGFETLPSGIYRCLIVAGQLFTSKMNATPGFKVEFQVIAGPFAERKIWHDIWLTDKALAMAKAELAKLGITDPVQLEQPVPTGLIADVTVVRRSNSDGTTFSRVRTFRIVDADVPADDYRPANDLDARSEADASRVSATPSIPARRDREPGDDDDLGDDNLDPDGFDWRHGVQRTPSAPLFDSGEPGPKGGTRQ
jgi:hypothetical protein